MPDALGDLSHPGMSSSPTSMMETRRTPTLMSLRFIFTPQRSQPKTSLMPGRDLFSWDAPRTKDNLGVADTLDEVEPPRHELIAIVHDEYAPRAHLAVVALLLQPEEVAAQILFAARRELV